jgi:esterase/lipase superfamily enzyme
MGATFRKLAVVCLTLAVAIAASDQFQAIDNAGFATAGAAAKKSKKKQAVGTDVRSWFLRKLPDTAIVAGYRATTADDDLETVLGTELDDYTSPPLSTDGQAADDLAGTQRAAAKALSEFESGYVQLRNRRLVLIGSSPRRELASIRSDLVAELPSGYRLAQMSVADKPYYVFAQRSGSGVELIGFVPDQEARNLLLEAALSVEDGIEVVDRLIIAPGAPARFAEAARTVVLQLKQLDAGAVVVAGTRFEIVGRADGIDWSEARICNQTLSLMPRGYACGYAFLDTVQLRRYGVHGFGFSRRGWSAGPHGGMGGKGKASGGPRRWVDTKAGGKPYGAVRPLQGQLVRLRPEGRDDQTVDLFFATNRKIARQPDTRPTFLDENEIPDARDTKLSFGLVRVRVPENREIGSLRLPRGISLFPLRFDLFDPKVHFYVVSRQLLSPEQWSAYVRELKPTDALVFVHGYNTTFDAAAFRLAQIVWDLRLPRDVRITEGQRFPGPLPVLFSWPSRGSVMSYAFDRESALGSRHDFIELLRLLRQQGIERVHVLAHSMGNFIVVDALANHAMTGDPIRIGELMMAAPDVDQDQFMRSVPIMQKIVGGMTLYASANDRAMVASRLHAGGIPRAGDVFNDRPIVIAGLDTIDVSAMGEEFLGLNHNTFASNRSLIDDIGLLLKEGRRAPRLPQLRPFPEIGLPEFWRFPR